MGVSIGTLLTSYGFSSTVSEGIEVIYSYNTVDPHIDYIDVGYSYSDAYNDSNMTGLVYANKAASTQRILNNLPLWMEMRKNYTSQGNKLVNAWGSQLEGVIDTYNTLRRDEFLATADTYYDVNLAVTELVTGTDKIYSPSLRNLIFNSSFSITGPSRYQKPLGWTASRDSIDGLTFDKTNSLFGDRALIISRTDLRQTREVSLPASPLTYSIFFKTENNTLSTEDTWDANEAGIILTIRYADNSIATYGVGFTKNTNTGWARTSLTVNASTAIYEVTVMIVNRTSYSYIVDCPMLEVSKTLNEWSPSILDVLPYSNLDAKTVTGVQVLFDTLDGESVKKIEVFPTATEEEFKNVSVPTRLEPFYPDKNPNNIINMAYGRYINFFDATMPTLWRALAGSIQEKSLVSNDVLGTRKPADLSMDEHGNLLLDLTAINNAQVTVKAVTVVDGMLYVLTQETYAGRTAYYIKFVQPHRATHEAAYLPSLGDLKLQLDLGTSFGIEAQSEDVVRVGTCKNIPGVIYIDTNMDRRLYFKLYYDYYYADFNNRKLYCRENYTVSGGHLQVI